MINIITVIFLWFILVCCQSFRL